MLTVLSLSAAAWLVGLPMGIPGAAAGSPAQHLRWGATAALGTPALGAPSAVATPYLKTVSAKNNSRTTTVTIEASDPVAYVMSQPDPLTVLIDLRNVRASGVSNGVTAKLGSVAAVSVEDTSATDGAPLARVQVKLAHPAAPGVWSTRNLILVDVERQPLAALGTPAQGSPTGAPNAAAALGTLAAAPQQAMSAALLDAPLPPATNLTAVRTSLEVQGTVITLSGNGQLQARDIQEGSDGQPRLFLEFPNVSTSAPSVTEVHQGPVERVRVAVSSRKPLVTRVVMDLNRRASYWVQPPEDDSRDFRVVFDSKPDVETGASIFAAQIGGPRPPVPAPPGTPALETPAPDPMTALTLRPATLETRVLATPPATPQSSANLVMPAGSSATGHPSAGAALGAPAAAPPSGLASNVAAQGGAAVLGLGQGTPSGAQMPAAPTAPQAPVVPPTVSQPASALPAQGRGYTGQPVVLDFQGADLRAVLRTFAEISGLNMVIDPTVQGSVDVALRDVPWDQALDIILRANKLSYVVDGTIVRIAPLTVLADEEGQRRKLAEEQALAGELRVLTRALSYAKAEDLAPLLTRTALTARGTVQVDPRTNTLILTDLPNALQTAGDLIGTLDRAQPQVEIEARIVQTTRNFIRTLGVQWGFNGRVAQDLGNTTGLAFPNQGSVTGRLGSIQGSFQGEPTDHAGSAVNLGVTGAATAIGLALGSVNGAVNLDLILSALEQTGQGRVLSTPRVSTQNNVEAEITQGLQIPIQTVANNTVTVTFKDAALTLRVTPQITAANTVIMRISLENASPDFSRAISGIPPIDTQRANTQVLVADGETTVIGGIYVNNQQTLTDQVPALGRIPLLGWLFKRDSLNDSSKELLVFITPRVTKM
jgi:type IV pilus assembly protein PilQ